jgi:ketosteroid isomerase-like protein
MPNDKADIEDQLTAWANAVNSGDSEGILRLVSDDFEMIPPDEDPVQGADAHAFLQGFFESDLAVKQVTSELIISGDIAVRRYSFELSMRPKGGGESEVLHGQGIHLLRRETDGSWKFIKDMYNELD